jgi:hypothetical protein
MTPRDCQLESVVSSASSIHSLTIARPILNERNGLFSSVTAKAHNSVRVSREPPSLKQREKCMRKKQANLLPEADWKHCQKCKRAIPDFELAEPLERELKELLKQHPGRAMTRLVQEAGCEPIVAKQWTLHHLPREATPCPWCGKPLRTKRAKQCRFCGKDWH